MEKRGTLLGLHIVPPTAIIVLGMAGTRAWFLFVGCMGCMVTTGIEDSWLTSSQRQHLGWKLLIDVGMVDRGHISWICTSFEMP